MGNLQNKNDRTSSPDGSGNPSADKVGGRLQRTAGGVLENIENLDAPKKNYSVFRLLINQYTGKPSKIRRKPGHVYWGLNQIKRIQNALPINRYKMGVMG